ncbi:helix-turn-helix transcriptional regulator [Streptomyces sp. NPDC001922]|uniref:helix-turn-helix transcriptional regulator n=1 Tax=Streptomyces sp. NPDC001922 TaxID=3364624 RepID=UPI0036CB6C15
MSDEQIDSVEALLEEARLTARMPGPAERLRLRQAADLSRAQVAAAVGVGRQTIANWEEGTSTPQPPGRAKYLRLLEGLAQLHPAPAEAPGAVPHESAVHAFAEPQTARDAEGRAVQG